MFFFLNLFYEVHIGNKCTFVCFNDFILGIIINMLILLLAFASKLCLVVNVFNFYQIDSINLQNGAPFHKSA